MSEVQVVETWLQKHERLLIVALVLLAGSYGVNHYLNNAAAKAETRAQVAEVALVDQKAIDTQLAAQTAQVQAQYVQMVDALAKQNAALANAVSSRNAGLQEQQGSDSKLPLSDLAKRLESLGNASPGSVSNTATTVVLTRPAAVAVTQTLEEVPVLQANLKDTQQLASNSSKELAQSNLVIGSLNSQVAGLMLQSKDADVACKAEVASVKASARKSKIRWFKIGFFTGLITGIYVGHAI